MNRYIISELADMIYVYDAVEGKGRISERMQYLERFLYRRYPSRFFAPQCSDVVKFGLTRMEIIQNVFCEFPVFVNKSHVNTSLTSFISSLYDAHIALQQSPFSFLDTSFKTNLVHHDTTYIYGFLRHPVSLIDTFFFARY